MTLKDPNFPPFHILNLVRMLSEHMKFFLTFNFCHSLFVVSSELAMAKELETLNFQYEYPKGGHLPYLPVYNWIFYSLKIGPKNHPQLNMGQKLR